MTDPDPKPGDTTDEPEPAEPRDDDASDPSVADPTDPEPPSAQALAAMTDDEFGGFVRESGIGTVTSDPTTPETHTEGDQE